MYVNTVDCRQEMFNIYCKDKIGPGINNKKYLNCCSTPNSRIFRNNYSSVYPVYLEIPVYMDQSWSICECSEITTHPYILCIYKYPYKWINHGYSDVSVNIQK